MQAFDIEWRLFFDKSPDLAIQLSFWAISFSNPLTPDADA
jgi:hypothetical protein